MVIIFSKCVIFDRTFYMGRKSKKQKHNEIVYFLAYIMMSKLFCREYLSVWKGRLRPHRGGISVSGTPLS